MTAYFIPLLFGFIFIFAFIKKVKPYDAFIDGAKSAVPFAVSVFPYLVAIFILTEISRKMLCKTRSSAFTDSTVSREFKDYILYFLIILIFGLICAVTDATMLSMVKTIIK